MSGSNPTKRRPSTAGWIQERSDAAPAAGAGSLILADRRVDLMSGQGGSRYLSNAD